MPTAAELIDETLGELQAFTDDTQLVTTLTGDIAATDLTFTVDSVRSGTVGISPGVIEIDSELMYATAVDPDGTVTVAAWGRGYNSTIAATHTANSRVTSQPTYPRSWVLKKLNQTVLRVFPELFAVKVVTLTTTVPSVTYDLPDDARWVLDARWQPPTGTSYWQGLKRWRISNGGTTVAGDPGVSVDVADRVIPGRPIEFTYAATPTELATESDDFAGVTGLPESCRDVIMLGAAAALTSAEENARLQLSSIEQQDRARIVQPSAALTTSRFLDQNFQMRLAEEKASLRRRWPARLSWSWV